MILTVPIIDKKRTQTFNVLVIVFVISLLLLIISVLYIDSKTFIIVSIILTLLSGVLINIKKSYTIIGELKLSKNEILIILNNNNYRFLFVDVSNYKLTLNDFENESHYNPKSLGSKDGTNNFIEFRYNDIKYKFQILLTQGNYFRIKNFR